MMIVEDQEKYLQHRAARENRTGNLGAFLEVGYAVLLFGSIGAITWAIRGSAEWGPIYGTIVPGLTWGLFWYYLCHRKGIDGKSVSLWLGLGIAIGGELGYGQFVSWIQGKFYAGDEILQISPWTGYLWFFITGIGWGAPGGIALGWALSGKNTFGSWSVRILVPVCVGYCGWLLVQACPWMFFPKYTLGIYAGNWTIIFPAPSIQTHKISLLWLVDRRNARDCFSTGQSDADRRCINWGRIRDRIPSVRFVVSWLLLRSQLYRLVESVGIECRI